MAGHRDADPARCVHGAVRASAGGRVVAAIGEMAVQARHSGQSMCLCPDLVGTAAGTSPIMSRGPDGHRK